MAGVPIPEAVLEAVRAACADLDAGAIEVLHRALYQVQHEHRRAELATFRAGLRPGQSAILNHSLQGGGARRGRKHEEWYVPTGTEVTVRRRHPSKPWHLVVVSVGPYYFADERIINVGHTGEHWVRTEALLPVDSSEARMCRAVAPAEAMLHRMIAGVR